MKRRGSILIAALLLIALIFVLGLAALSRSAARQRTLGAQRDFAQARQLAQAGLADVEAKLSRDLHFPPPVENENQLFAYTEPVYAMDGVLLGHYTVTVDGRRAEPYQMLLVRSVGKTGGDPERPEAEAVVQAEFDLAPVERGGSAINPYFYRVRLWQE